MPTPVSARNPVLKEIRKAVARGSLTESGLCVAEGFNVIAEALRSDCEIQTLYATESAQTAVDRYIAGRTDIRAVLLSDDLFRGIAATGHSQGVLALVRPRHWTLEQVFNEVALVVVLDGIQDPGNAGTVLRAAEAFGATGVVFCKGSVNPYNPKAVRASAGSIFRMPLVAPVNPDNLLASIQKHDVKLFAMVPKGEVRITEARLDSRCAIVIGGEARGVSGRLRENSVSIRIPTVGVESLNAAMAATVVLNEAHMQRTVNSE